MALSDHHYTSAQFHLHLIILISLQAGEEECACVHCVRLRRVHGRAGLCTLRYHVFARTHMHACVKGRVVREKEREREGDTYIRCGHYTSCGFHLHLIVCLTAGGGKEKEEWGGG